MLIVINIKEPLLKKYLNTLIRYLRFTTKNPYLKYDLPLGIGEPVKLNHILTEEEMKLFVCYLNSKKLYVLVVMFILLFKFELIIGVLAKMKVCDIIPDGIIIFREKNNEIIKRELLNETFEVLTLLIDECELKDDNYLFYFFKFKNNENKRSIFLNKI